MTRAVSMVTSMFDQFQDRDSIIGRFNAAGNFAVIIPLEAGSGFGRPPLINRARTTSHHGSAGILMFCGFRTAIRFKRLEIKLSCNFAATGSRLSGPGDRHGNNARSLRTEHLPFTSARWARLKTPPREGGVFVNASWEFRGPNRREFRGYSAVFSREH